MEKACFIVFRHITSMSTVILPNFGHKECFVLGYELETLERLTGLLAA